jgi:hypothetical protein
MKRLLVWLAPLGLLLTGVVGEGKAGPFQPSSIGPFHVSPFNTYYDQFTGGNGGTLFTAAALPAGATALQFSATGSVITFPGPGGTPFGPDGFSTTGGTGFSFTNSPTAGGGTYLGTRVGATTGNDPALYGIFFNPSFTGTPANSLNYLNGVTPDQRTLSTYSPSLNQPFFIGDGLDQNNNLGVTGGNPQTFNIPAGATELLLGIGPDNNLNDNAGLGFDVRVFDNAGSQVLPPGVPEPGTLALLGLGIGGVVVVYRRRRTGAG